MWCVLCDPKWFPVFFCDPINFSIRIVSVSGDWLISRCVGDVCSVGEPMWTRLVFALPTDPFGLIVCGVEVLDRVVSMWESITPECGRVVCVDYSEPFVTRYVWSKGWRAR